MYCCKWNNVMRNKCFGFSRLKATKATPLKVIFVDEQVKHELLLKARDLRKTQFNQVFIVKDLKEREQNKVLITERDTRKKQGEDVIIFRGKVLPRWKKTGQV